MDSMPGILHISLGLFMICFSLSCSSEDTKTPGQAPQQPLHYKEGRRAVIEMQRCLAVEKTKLMENKG
jgi:hypothetical protein